MAGKTPSVRLQQALTVAKVEAVETSIDLCSELHKDDTATATTTTKRYLSQGNSSDFLLCCKHAEGESHVLMQKMTRDLLSSLGGEVDANNGPVEAALHDLQRGIMHAQIQSGCHLIQAWEECSDLVYGVADAHMDSVLTSYGCLLRG
jgi:acyl-CoA oxidase